MRFFIALSGSHRNAPQNTRITPFSQIIGLPHVLPRNLGSGTVQNPKKWKILLLFYIISLFRDFKEYSYILVILNKTI